MGEETIIERQRGIHARHYRAWLLRSWATHELTDPTGKGRRYSLEDPYTGAQRGFASLAALIAYLQAEAGADAEASHASGKALLDPE